MPFVPVRCQRCLSLRSDCCAYTSPQNLKQPKPHTALVINEFENTLTVIQYIWTWLTRPHATKQRIAAVLSISLLGLQLYSPSAWWTRMRSHASSEWRLKLKDWPLQNMTWHLRLTVNHKMCLDAERNQSLKSQAMAPHQATCCWVHSSAGFIQKNERWRAHQGDRERQLSLAPVSQKVEYWKHRSRFKGWN